MTKRRYLSILALVLSLALVAAACGGDDDDGDDGDGGATGPTATTGEDGGVTTGGTYRIETDGIAYTSGGDPTGEYLGLSFGIFTNLLQRTLLTYYHDGERGNELVEDLADFPEVSADGLTYTFTLKDGIMFGDPVNREITSADVEYAFRRMATESLVAQYAFYYEGIIDGLEVGEDPGPGGIPGIETPDDKTIVFHLTRVSPEFPFLVSMPATGPMPEEVAGCFAEAGEYGRYVVSSGPYQYEGVEALDASSCDALTASGPISGFDPEDHSYFERNPAYDPATDSPEVRANYVDRITIDVNTNLADIFDRIERGEIDGHVGSGNPPADVLQRYSTSEELEDRLMFGQDDRTWYITMNLTTPPFDDIHVRNAVNLVMDKAAILQAWGGPINGEIATHIQPPALTGGTPTNEEYDPYPSPDWAGDVDAAMEEMRQSAYDTDGDGLCDAPECSGVVMVNRNTSPWTEAEPVVVDSLAQIGIEVDVREAEDHYTIIQTVANETPIAMNPGWGKDFPDSSSFVGFLHDGRGIACEGNFNYSLVGLTPEKAEECGIDFVEVPSVDADIDNCKEVALEGDLEATNQCWIALDQKLMEEVVPWVPYLWPNVITTIGPAVTVWEFDQFAGTTAFSKVAVDPSMQA
ncbi:MAG TPA: ABC transporter substrate-binding protein [Actinomycetota bacterium]|nr:ABC transporter substrate-binding protein [Actinomycetota bacterium]